MKILLGTKNRGKVRDFEVLFANTQFEFISEDQWGELPEVEEDGSTFEENALKKARELFAHTGVATLADDSGLEVKILDDSPGVYSARYAGEPSNDRNNNEKLLDEMKSYTRKEDREARFVCCLAYVDAESTHIEYGTVSGWIAYKPRGLNGFGYDPLFAIAEMDGKTAAEIAPEQKAMVSHRARAMKKMKDYLLTCKTNGNCDM